MARVETDKEIWMSGVVRVVKRRWRALAKQARGWMGGRTVSDTDGCVSGRKLLLCDGDFVRSNHRLIKI